MSDSVRLHPCSLTERVARGQRFAGSTENTSYSVS